MEIKSESSIKPIAQPVSNSYSKPAAKSENMMTEAIKAYRDEYLTGLTDEEKEEIDKKVKAYLKEKPVKNNADRESLKMYIRSLLMECGFKGKCEDSIAAIMTECLENGEQAKGDNVMNTEALTAYQKDSAINEVVKSRVLNTI